MQTTFAGSNGALQNIFTGYYDAWGVCTVVSDETEEGIAAVNPFRYRSYYYDTETGMYYLQSRYTSHFAASIFGSRQVNINVRLARCFRVL